MTERKYTCIICPKGCEITATLDKDKIVGITGNTCRRGETYVREELTAPMRTLTTTVASASGRPVPVRTAAPVPKSKLFECMDQIGGTVAPAGIKAGDVIITDIAGTGVSLIATADDA